MALMLLTVLVSLCLSVRLLAKVLTFGAVGGAPCVRLCMWRLV